MSGPDALQGRMVKAIIMGSSRKLVHLTITGNGWIDGLLIPTWRSTAMSDVEVGGKHSSYVIRWLVKSKHVGYWLEVGNWGRGIQWICSGCCWFECCIPFEIGGDGCERRHHVMEAGGSAPAPRWKWARGRERQRPWPDRIQASPDWEQGPRQIVRKNAKHPPRHPKQASRWPSLP